MTAEEKVRHLFTFLQSNIAQAEKGEISWEDVLQGAFELAVPVQTIVIATLRVEDVREYYPSHMTDEEIYEDLEELKPILEEYTLEACHDIVAHAALDYESDAEEDDEENDEEEDYHTL